MEFVEGTPLEGVLQNGPLPIPDALRYCSQVLEALAYGFGAPSLISQVLGAVAATGAEPANTMARRPWRVITWWQR